MVANCLRVGGGRLSWRDGDGVLGTDAETRSEAVAEDVVQQDGAAVNYLYGPLGAGRDAIPAARAPGRVYRDDVSDPQRSHPQCLAG